MFRDNFAKTGGGDIGLDKSASLYMVQSTLSRGVAGNDGGAIALYVNSSAIILNSVIANASIPASGEGGGGAVSISGHSKLTMEGTTLEGCTCHGFDGLGLMGGAIYASDEAMVSLANTSVTRNAASKGGGICMSGNSSIVMKRVVFSSNQARTGGAVQICDSSSTTLQGVVFTNNTASDSGGGLTVVNNATLAVRSSLPTRFQDNSAASCGGGMFVNSGTPDSLTSHELLLIQMENNSAPRSADICVAASKVDVVGSNSSLDNFITSIDSQGGLLYVILRVDSGICIPSDSPFQVTVVDGRNNTLSTHTLAAAVPVEGSGGLVTHQVAVKLRHPPGESACNHHTVMH